MRLPTVFFAEGGGGRPGDTDYPASRRSTRGRSRCGRACRARAADRDRQGPLLRRQRRDRGLLGPDRRDRGRLARHGRAGDDRGRRARRGGPGRRRPDRDAGAQRRGRRRGRRRGGGGRGDQAAARLLPGRDAARAPLPTRPALRDMVPERQRRAYDVAPDHRDAGRRGLGRLPARAVRARDGHRAGRIEGRAVGVIANNTMYMAGAITSEGADKAARFIQLCDAFGLPVVSLVDTPGMMVGPEGRGDRPRAPHVTAAGRGRGAAGAVRGGRSCAAATGSARRRWWAAACTSRCSRSRGRGDLGPMGLEGAVRLGLRKELEAIADEERARAARARAAAAAEQNAKALNAATLFELDDVIDLRRTRAR